MGKALEVIKLTVLLYIVVKCYERLALAVVRATMSDTFCSIASIRVLSGVYNNLFHELYYQLIQYTQQQPNPCLLMLIHLSCSFYSYVR